MEEDFIIEVLDLFRSKLKRRECTKQQTDAIYKAITENLDIYATADEIANHYGKTRTAVHSVIKNKLIQRPKRNITMYPFKAFRRVVPSSWLNHR